MKQSGKRYKWSVAVYGVRLQEGRIEGLLSFQSENRNYPEQRWCYFAPVADKVQKTADKHGFNLKEAIDFINGRIKK